MNALLRTAVLSLSALGLSACAGMHERSGSSYVPPQRSPSVIEEDHAYVSKVEAMARRRGIDVVWINPPRKQVSKIASNTDD